jgi:hypothetical protein
MLSHDDNELLVRTNPGTEGVYLLVDEAHPVLAK